MSYSPAALASELFKDRGSGSQSGTRTGLDTMG